MQSFPIKRPLHCTLPMQAIITAEVFLTIRATSAIRKGAEEEMTVSRRSRKCINTGAVISDRKRESIC